MIPRLILAFCLLALPLYAQPWSGILDPARAIDWSTAGAGTIPARSGSPCQTIAAGATVATINTAISNCAGTANPVVQLAAGNFSLSSQILIAKSNVTLRGAGPDQTFLTFTGTGSCNGWSGHICIYSGDGNWWNGKNNNPGWTASSYARGQTTITLASRTNLKVGSIIALGQNNDSNGTAGYYVCVGAGTCSWQGASNSSEQYQMVEVTSCGSLNTLGALCTGAGGTNVITFTPGLYAPDWASAKSPTAWYGTNLPVTGVGIENLSIDNRFGTPFVVDRGIWASGTSYSVGDEVMASVGSGNPTMYLCKLAHTSSSGNKPPNATDWTPAAVSAGITFWGTNRSWVENVRSMSAGWAHVELILSSHDTVRDSYFFGGSGSSEGYGINSEIGSSDNLIENNISQHLANFAVTEGDSGSVFSYNYSVDNYFGQDPTPSNNNWQQNDSTHHSIGDHYELYEGFEGIGHMLDIIHGTSNVTTTFRNRWSGRDTATLQGIKTAATIPYLNLYGNRFSNAIGNVLGTSGYHTNYQTIPPNGTDCSGNGLSIFSLGYSDGNGTGTLSCAGAGGPGNDLELQNDIMRWGNYSVVTQSSDTPANSGIRFVASEVPSGNAYLPNAVPANTTLPSSFYLSAKPSWWAFPSGNSATPWPAIGPDVTGGNIANVAGHAWHNPAANCYLNVMSGRTDGGSGVLTFNANSCYAAQQSSSNINYIGSAQSVRGTTCQANSQLCTVTYSPVHQLDPIVVFFSAVAPLTTPVCADSNNTPLTAGPFISNGSSNIYTFYGTAGANVFQYLCGSVTVSTFTVEVSEYQNATVATLTGGTNSGASSPATIGSATTQENGDWVVGALNAASVAITPNCASCVLRQQSPANPQTIMIDLSVPTAGNATLSGTFSGSANWTGALLELRPASPIAATPTFSIATPLIRGLYSIGWYASSQSLTLASSSGAIVCWNTTGNPAPATNGTTGCATGSNLYSGPITVSSTETIYAIGGGTGFTDGLVGSASYGIGGICQSGNTGSQQYSLTAGKGSPQYVNVQIADEALGYIEQPYVALSGMLAAITEPFSSFCGPQWASGSYVAGNLIEPIRGGDVWQAQTSGTTAGTQPALFSGTPFSTIFWPSPVGAWVNSCSDTGTTATCSIVDGHGASAPLNIGEPYNAANVGATIVLAAGGTIPAGYAGTHTVIGSCNSGGVCQGISPAGANTVSFTASGLASGTCSSFGTNACSIYQRGTQVTDGGVTWQDVGPQNQSLALTPTCSLAASILTCTNPNSGTTLICYATSPTVPATNGGLGTSCTTGTKYTAAVTMSSGQTLNLVAGVLGMPDSFTATYTYVTASLASLSPSSITFVSQIVGTTSAGQVATLQNTGGTTLNIASIAITGDFAKTTTCGSTLASGASCTITVTFTPTQVGARAGTLTVTDDSAGVGGSTQTVSLTGTGSGVASGVASKQSGTFRMSGAWGYNKPPGGGSQGDNTPPVTVITYPLNGGSVSGTVNVTATADDNVGVNSAQLWIDGANSGIAPTISGDVYTFAWVTSQGTGDPTGLTGPHTLQTKAWDAAANLGVSAVVNVTVVAPSGDCSKFATSTSVATPGPPTYGGLRNDCVTSNISTIPNVWTNYTADYGLTGAGKCAVNAMGLTVCRVTDGNSDSAFTNFAYAANYSGSDDDEHISIDGSMFGIARQAGSQHYMYLSGSSKTAPTQMMNGAAPFVIPSKQIAFSQVTPKVAYVLGGASGVEIDKWDMRNCTASACVPGSGAGTYTLTTMYDIAAGACLPGLNPTHNTIWRVNGDDSIFMAGFSPSGGQNTDMLVSAIKCSGGTCSGAGNGCRVYNSCPANNLSATGNCVSPGSYTPPGGSHCTAAGCVSGAIPASTVIGEWGTTGPVHFGCATGSATCTGSSGFTPGATFSWQGGRVHESYLGYASAGGTPWAEITILGGCLQSFSTPTTSATSCQNDSPFIWNIAGTDLIAQSQGGHFGVGYKSLVHGTNNPQSESAFVNIINGGALTTAIANLNTISTSSPNNLPAPGPNSYSLDMHGSFNYWNQYDTNPTFWANTSSWVADFGSPPVSNVANNGCVIPNPLWAATGSMPACGTGNPFSGYFVNEELVVQSSNNPGGTTTCSSAPCSTQSVLRPGNSYITGISWNFNATNATQTVSPDGRYYLITSDWLCTLGLKNGYTAGSDTGICGGINWQKANNYNAGDIITSQSNNNTAFCTYTAPNTCHVSGTPNCTSAPNYATGSSNPAYPNQPVWVTGGSCNNNVPDGTGAAAFQWQLVGPSNPGGPGKQNMRNDVFQVWLTP